ncbi:DUF1564 family protein [Leptospira sp. WS92.C1]
MGHTEGSNSKQEISLKKKGSPVTLLIPENLVRLRKLKAAKLNQELNYLLKKYGTVALKKNFLGKNLPAISYQNKGLTLKKMNFRPNEKDWVELGIIALGLGVSKCLLFAILEEWECSNEVPREFWGGALTKITLLRKIHLSQNKFSTEFSLSPT